MNCPGCRQALHEDARFCSHCGLSTVPIHTSTNNNNQQDTIKYSRSPDMFSGRILHSKYELIERLGEGGMGAVYRARRLHIGDEVAVKVLHPDLVVEAEAVERFRREARSAAMISHPNVVSIHDFSDAQSEGTPAYIVMELVRGTSLRNILKSEGRLAPERGVKLMRDVCAGVGVAHRQGVVHRDLKPDNVIVSPASHEGEPETAKVVDFGIAKLRDLAAEAGLTQTGTVVGTIYYMSPEQCRGEELDPRGDVYSLGAMLYEMLTGEPPFKAKNLTGLITKHLNEAPPPLAPELKIPKALAAICYKALAKNRDERPADALMMRRELQAAFGPSVGSSHKPAWAESHSRPYGWIKWAVGGFGAVFLVLAIAGAIGVYIYNSWSTRPDPRYSGNITEENSSGIGSAKATNDLRGTWLGTFGPLKQTTRLIIKHHKENGFDGILEQGEVTVAVIGTFDPVSRDVTLKEVEVLRGHSWNLGENVGKVSTDGKKMLGTGKDPIGGLLGLSYEWAFSR